MQVTSLSNSIYALEDDKHMENSTQIIYRKGFGVYYSLDLILVLLFYIIF